MPQMFSGRLPQPVILLIHMNHKFIIYREEEMTKEYILQYIRELKSVIDYHVMITIIVGNENVICYNIKNYAVSRPMGCQ